MEFVLKYAHGMAMLTKTFIEQALEQADIKLNGNRPQDIKVIDDQFYHKLRLNTSLGAGEAYVEGLWECDQLDELFYKLCMEHPDSSYYSKLSMGIGTLLNKIFNWQTRFKSKEVAKIHYNLGNDLYSYMLGKTMAYTCAYWKKAKTLDEAQFDKFDLVCRKVNLKQGDHVLELGCGWGSFAKFAAENYGCKVTAVNISEEQIRFANENAKNLPVQYYLCDYRDVHIYNPNRILFDKVVSIGLCEHIGSKNYSTFIKIARDNIKKEGLFLLHTIGKNYTLDYVDPWINKYIFPNGMLPSIKQLAGAMEYRFIMEDLHNFGADYDKTLMAWHHNFNANWDKLNDKYGQAFFRQWNYYLLSCAGAFRARGMQLWQIVLSPTGVLGGYDSIR